jgi:cytochrome c oxidase cbb3-type subunit 2
VVGCAAFAQRNTPAAPSAGARLYEANCAICHGAEGRGNGREAHRFSVPPRDFVKGVYRFRTTPSGKLPTDQDLRRSIVHGLGGTAMVPQDHLKPDEVDAVIEFIKSLSPRFAAEPPAKPLRLPVESPKTDDSIARGREVYEEAGCGNCHGDGGRGDGSSAKDLSMPPADLTRHPLKGGSTAADIVRTVVTGLNGSPMPSYHLMFDDPDFWALAYYVESLGTDRGMTEQEKLGWEVEGRRPR